MPSDDRPEPPRPGRILVIDADRRVRQSISDLIGLADDLELTGAVADGALALSSLEARPADVVLIDPNLPDEAAGLALLAAMHVRWPAMALVVMSCSASVELLTAALEAATFVPKAGDPESLVEALRRAAPMRPALDRAEA